MHCLPICPALRHYFKTRTPPHCWSRGPRRGGGRGGALVPQHLPELLELVVRDLSADGLQPLRHEALPQRLADDVVGDQAQDAVQALLQLGHRAARLVPVAAHLLRLA